LELGSGFNPEFTGKENVYMNGALLGLSKEEINEKYDSIVEFADIGDFIDQPVKTYSSGMYVRLGFAVAVNVDPDILVVDEALAVGDEIFQRKCFSRIRAIREKGGTILFVSHSAAAVIDLCDRAYLLDRGEAIMSDMPQTVIAKYYQLCCAPAEKQEALRQEIRGLNVQDQLKPGLQSIPSLHLHSGQEEPRNVAFYDPNLVPKSTFSYLSDGAKISDPHITTLDGRIVNNLVRQEDYYYTYTVAFTKPAFSVRAAMLIKTITGSELGGGVSSTVSEAIPSVQAGTKLLVRFKFQCLLAPGVYFLNAGVEGVVGDRCIDAAVFRVQAGGESIATGIVDFCVRPYVEVESMALVEGDKSGSN
jgi:lipopolysaccharide transport system ATP-binding protein